MLAKCPKCFYQRKATDTAPDWQCPSCGVAYNKVSPEAIAARSAQQAAARSPRTVSTARTQNEESGPGMKTIAVAVGLVLLFGFGFWKYKHAPVKPATELASAEFDEGRKAFDNSNYDLAYKKLLPSAEKGNPVAQFYIGSIFQFSWGSFNGDRHPADPKEELRWLTKSAEQGYLPAELALAKMIESGFGGTDDRTTATAWYRKAADQGDAYGEYRVGGAYEHGIGVEKSDAQASNWYRRSAEQGFGGGLSSLAKLYAEGRGVTQNVAAAYALYKLAADANKLHPEEEGAFWAPTAVAQLDKQLTPGEREQGVALAKDWTPGHAFPF